MLKIYRFGGIFCANPVPTSSDNALASPGMPKAQLQDPTVRDRLAAFIAAASGQTVGALEASPLAGGAIQENWLVDVVLAGRREQLVLRTDAPSRVPMSHGRAQEFALLCAAHAAGVTVPEPLWLCRDPAVLGQDFYLMRRIAGVAQGIRIVKDLKLGGDRKNLAVRLGNELARIHTVRPGATGLQFLALPRSSPALDEIARLRADLDRRDNGHPVLEWGLRWLERTAPSTAEIVLVHHDFRSGNYMVDENGLTGILDWEFAAWGDPMTDIGWFCAKCWRYGADALEAGGIAPRADFYRGYEAASGRRIHAEVVRYWEVMAHLRWAVIALQQMDRHVSGGEQSLELALTGRVLPELERTIIELIEPGPWPAPAAVGAGAAEQPPASILLAEARRVLLEGLLPALPEERRLEARMIANAMAIGGRESAAFRPASADSRALSAAIRAGGHDVDRGLRDRLAAEVLARLAISNPKALPK
jgi:aminoglycoside phosphotransferase (APT) family kinase protein